MKCSDGGTCHHECKRPCWRRDKGGCVPLSSSGLTDDWRAQAQAAQDQQRHREQLARWCVQWKIPAPSGPVVDAFVAAMKTNQYGVEETGDAFCWFRTGYGAGLEAAAVVCKAPKAYTGNVSNTRATAWAECADAIRGLK